MSAPAPANCARPRVRRAGAVRWGAILFLVGFTILFAAVASYCLLPGMQAAVHATNDDDKRRLVAWYRLLLAIMLLILFSGLMLTFRFGRFFLPRPTPAPTRTEYVDAWAESAKRVKLSPADDDDDSDDPRDDDDDDDDAVTG